MIKRNSLINGRIEMVKCDFQNNIEEHRLDDPTEYLEERNLLDQRLCGISCVRVFVSIYLTILYFLLFCRQGIGMTLAFLS